MGLRTLAIRDGRRRRHAKNGNPAVNGIDRRGSKLMIMPVQDQLRPAAAEDGQEFVRVDQPFAPGQPVRTGRVMQQYDAAKPFPP